MHLKSLICYLSEVVKTLLDNLRIVHNILHGKILFGVHLFELQRGTEAFRSNFSHFMTQFSVTALSLAFHRGRLGKEARACPLQSKQNRLLC